MELAELASELAFHRKEIQPHPAAEGNPKVDVDQRQPQSANPKVGVA